MKHIYLKFTLLLTTLLLLGASAIHAQNSLKVADVSAGPGEKSNISVELNNTGQVTGFQFTLTVPAGLIVSEKSAQLTTRKGDQVVYPQRISNTQFMFIGFSPTNEPFNGNSGAILEIPIELPVDYQQGTTYPLSLSAVILSSTTGVDIGSNHQSGTLIVGEPKTPDLEVSGVTISDSEVSPNGTISTSWGIKNIGKAVASGGWTEQATLVSTQTGDRYLLGSVSYTGDLSINETVGRTGKFNIPKMVGLDGDVKVEINIIPNAAIKELESAKANNKAQSSNSALLKKMLFLSFNNSQIDENATGSVRATLIRSGNISALEQFPVSCSMSSQLTFPATVSIGQNQSSAAFDIQPIDNTVADGNRKMQLLISGNGYLETSQDITIIDNEVGTVTLTSSKNTVTDGDQITITLQTNIARTQDITFTLTTDQASRWNVPASILLPAGNTSVTIPVGIDVLTTVEPTVTGKITAKADGYKAGTVDVSIVSANIPAFEFIIAPGTISKGDGPYATYAVINRLDKSQVAVTIQLSADKTGALVFPATVNFPAGVTQQKFNIGAISNDIVEGTKTVNLTASIYLPSCSCITGAGTGGAELTQPVTILDDNGLALKIKSNPSTVKAGQTDAAKITISRNTTDLSTPVNLRLSSDMPSVVSIPATATIPAGQGSVDVSITTIIDPGKSGDQTVRLQAEADNYTSGFGWILVTDQNKPDAAVTGVTASLLLIGGGNAEVKTTIANQGFITLMKGAKVEYYLSKTKSIQGGILLATDELDSDINVGSRIDFTRTILLPDKAGNYYILVVINSNQKINELSAANNQGDASVQLLPAYTATVAVDKILYKSEEAINISGTAKFADNTPAGNKDIEITISNNSGFVRTVTSTTNESGNYSYNLQALPGENGHYTVAAGYPGASNQAKTEFDIAGFEWKNKPSGYLTWEVVEFNSLQGEFSLKNNTNIQLSGVQIILPDGVDFTLSASPVSIPAGGTVSLAYTIIPKAPSAGRDYIRIPAQIVSNEGAKLDFVGWYFCHPQTAKLAADPVSINTTMTKGSTRYYEIKLINGAIEAKNVKINIPSVDWMSLATPQTIPVVAPYDTVKVGLQLKPTDQLQLNVPITGNIGVGLDNGNGFQIPFKLEPVSESTGSVQIDVTDDYTYNTASAPHLQGAKVTISHPFTGSIIAEGLTDSNGLFTADNIPEGNYTLSVSAGKHGNYQNNIMVDPGKMNPVTAYLPLQVVTYTWTVVPTEIQDKYQTDLTVQFETNVPRPVLIFDFDKTVIDLQPGESKMLDLTITNYGLIKANDVMLQAPSVTGYRFTLLTDYFPSISAKTSVTVPLLIQRDLLRGASGCIDAVVNGSFKVVCGLENMRDEVAANIPLKTDDFCEINVPGGKYFEFLAMKDGPALTPNTGSGGNCKGDDCIGPTSVFPGLKTEYGSCSKKPKTPSSAPENKNNNIVENSLLRSATAVNSVCATVTVKFSQTITMTRDAFEGTLTMENGGVDGTISDINLDLAIYDENGEDATYLFQINKDAFLSGSGSVGAQNSGTGTVIFIPTKQVAPTVPLSYSFGGTLSYFDPGIGEKVTVQLFPVTLQVNPSPDLVLDYFMQRDVIADDPLTQDVVEPSVPAELALMITNEGYGTAKNVQVESMQPEIIDNLKGLLINFNLVGCNFNNEPKQLGLLNVNFGNIEPKKSAVGEWWFTSTLLGHFKDFQINVTHLNSFGNKNLSLIKSYQLHELIKSVKAYGVGQDDINDFLVNDIPDIDCIPDKIYYSNGGSDDVYTAQAASASSLISASRLTSTLSVTPYMMGWNYGKIDDPGKNQYKLVKVIRNSDNLEMPAENFWQTFVTLKTGSNPIYENKLHFLDKITAPDNYTLYYTPVNTDYPKVDSFKNVPAEMATTPVENIIVKFNKPIDPSSFTTGNLQLMYQGSYVPVDNILIGKIDSVNYSLNMQAVTTASGYYELIVQCIGIKDLLGNTGQEGKSTHWTQVMGELGIISFTTDQVKSQPLNSIEILFNKTVAPNQFTKEKVTLNGEPLGDYVSIITNDNLHYTIVGLSAYNNLSGDYELSVNVPAIKSENNISGLLAQSCKWKVDVVMPAVKYFTALYQGAINSQNVTDMLVTLTKPIINGFDAGMITLYKGSVNQNASLNLSRIDSLQYLISGLGTYTYSSGGYKLSVNQSGFLDSLGNYGTGQVDTAWVVSLVKPAAPTGMKIVPDRGNSNNDNATFGNDLSISFTTTANQQKIALYGVTPQGETLIKEQYVENAGTVNIPITGYDGKVTFKAIVYDVYGNESNPVSIDVFIDTGDLSAEIIPVKIDNSGCPGELSYVSVLFTDDIQPSEFTNEILSLNAGGASLSIANLVITPVSGNEFKIENFDNINNNGDITIGVNLAMLHKKLSGMQGLGIISKNIGTINNYSVQITGKNVAATDDMATYTATPGMLDYSWSVTGGSIMATQLNSVTILWNSLGNQTLTLVYTTPNNCMKTITMPVQIQSGIPLLITWQGSSDNVWDNYLNWEGEHIPNINDTVIIPGVADYFPVLTKSVSVNEIHFMPGARIGGQHFLTGKAFVSYNFRETNRWHMISMPLAQAYPGDFFYGGYPVAWVRTLEMKEASSAEGSLTSGVWVTSRGNATPFTYGDGFVFWLNDDTSTVDKGLKLLGGIRELPFFQRQATGSPDKTLYDKVDQVHDYDSSKKESTFYNYLLNGSGEYVRDKNTHYTVSRSDSAYQLLSADPFNKPLNFANNAEAQGNVALVGNPYMAALDFEALYDENSGAIKPDYQVWTGSGYSIYSKYGYAGGTGEGALSQYISPLQSFIVEKPETPSSVSLNFTESMATANEKVNLRSSLDTENKLNIVAQDSAGEVLTFIAKRDGGQEIFGDLDARKIINTINEIPEIYTLKPYKGSFVAVAVNITNSDDLLIPVGLATSYAGNITLSFSGMDNYNANLSLIDAETNRTIDLTGLSSYKYPVNYTPKTVNGETSVCENRFFISISKVLTGLNDPQAGKVSIYEVNGRIQIISSISNPIKEAEVYNLQGALMYKTGAIHAASFTINHNWLAGAYIVKVISEKSVDNVKLIIK